MSMAGHDPGLTVLPCQAVKGSRRIKYSIAFSLDISGIDSILSLVTTLEICRLLQGKFRN
jgi:hypothetical protein